MSEELANQHLKTIVKGTGIVMSGLVLSKLFAYIFRIFIARYFGPGDYGIFSLGLAVVGFFTLLALLGFQSGIIRYTAYYRAKKNEGGVKGVLTSTIKIIIPVSVIVSLSMIFASPYLAVSVFNEPALTGILIILAISIPFSALLTIFVSFLVGFKEIKYRVYSENIALNLGKLAFIISFGMLGLGILGIAWAWTIATVLAFLSSVYFLLKFYPVLKIKIASISIKRELLVYSMPLLLTSSMSFALLWMDTLMLGFFMDASDVGIYNAAVPTAQFLIMFPNALIPLFLPIITELFANGKKVELKKVYKTVSRWIFYINLPIFLLLVVFSRQLLNILFGPEYMSGYLALIIVSTGIFLRKGLLSASILEMYKRTKYVLYTVVAATAANISLNCILIPIYGIVGAALATFFTYLFAFSLHFIFAYHFSRINPLSFGMAKSFAAGILSVGIVYSAARLLFSSFPLYVMVVLFLAFVSLYFLLLMFFKAFNRDDIEIVKSIERKTGIKLKFLRTLHR